MNIIACIALILTGTVFSLFLIFCNAVHFGLPASDINVWKTFAEVYGPLTSPIIGILGFLGIILTIKSQSTLSNKEMSHGYAIDLLKHFNEIRKDISTEKHDGAMAFKEFLSEWFGVYAIVKSILNPTGIPEITKAIDVAYIFFFFGPNEKSDSYFQDMDKELLKRIHDEISREKSVDAKGREIKKFRGNQDQLGQYARFLFNSFEYIYLNKNLNNEEKKAIGKLFRASLSSQELALLALNCKSQLGQEWIDGGMLEYFQIPKNIPEQYFVKEGCGFTITELYPKISYEWQKGRTKKQNISNTAVPL